MRYFLMVLQACLLMGSVSISAFGKETPEWQASYDCKEIRNMFDDPPKFYAPHVFWFWDDVIRDEQMAATMADEMTRQHLNPGYAHPRSGFDPSVPALPLDQYLSETWFNAYKNAVDAAGRNGYTLGYCDEYNWPSGQVGGRLLQEHPELEAKYLSPKRYLVKGGSQVSYDEVDFAVAGKLADGRIDAGTLRIIGSGPAVSWSAPVGDWVVYTYSIKSHPGIDGGKVNYIDPRLMKTFIPMVHEQYQKHVGSEMGKTIPGVFVDNEGDFGWQIAWSDYFAEQYKKIKKQDIRVWLPLLTEEDKDGIYVKARCDWFDVVSDVYNACYFKPLVKWLSSHNMYYISNLWEESIMLVTTAVGDLMRTNRNVTMPGTDCLEMKSQDVHDFKETQSVAEFEGRPFMSEIMGVAGWNQSPEMMKMTINSITSFGVNHVVPHGIYLNRKIETVPFPTDWYNENPYWRYMHIWADFARRAAFVTRQSRLVADVLLISPLENAWAFSEGYFSDELEGRDTPWDERVVETDRVYSEAMREMSANNIDFLIGDKHYLSLGEVLPSKSGDVRIRIKNHDFRAIVLPPSYVISRSSLQKISDFASKGGCVVLLGALPTGSPEKGLNDEVIIKLSNSLRSLPNVIDLSGRKDAAKELPSSLANAIEESMQLEKSGRLYTAHRAKGNVNYYWLANNTDDAMNVTARFRDGEGGAEIWNCETGEITTIPSVREGDYIRVSLNLNPYEGYWVVFNPDTEEIAAPSSTAQPNQAKVLSLNGNWEISYPEADTVYKTTAKVLYSKDAEIDSKKLKSGYNDSNWQYFNKQHSGDYTFSYWRYNIPLGAESVIVPDYFVGKDIFIDNQKVHVADSHVSIPSASRLLALAIGKEDECAVEPLSFVLSPSPTDVSLESWYSYGLQQFTGFIDYETAINFEERGSEMILDLGEVKYMAEVFVNDQSVGCRLWKPFRFDISKYVRSGRNTIKVRVGNLIANHMWMLDDMSQLRTWGWRGTPDLLQCDAGLFGPVRVMTQE